MARAAGVDRRVVTATVRTIEKSPELRAFFDRLRPTCNLRDVAPLMEWGAIEIVPTNASKPGILAAGAAIIAEAGISVRQVIMDDPEAVDDPHGVIVMQGPLLAAPKLKPDRPREARDRLIHDGQDVGRGAEDVDDVVGGGHGLEGRVRLFPEDLVRRGVHGDDSVPLDLEVLRDPGGVLRGVLRAPDDSDRLRLLQG